MKKIIFLLATMFALAPVCAIAAPANDEKDWEVSHPFKSSDDENKHWKVTTSGVYIGAGIDHSWDLVNNSVEAGWLNLVGLEYNTLHGQTFSLGAGFHHRSYSLKRPNMLTCDESTHIVSTVPYPDLDYKKRSSKLNTWAIQFPLTFEQKIYKSFSIKVGGIMNWNFLAKTKTHYEVGNTAHDIAQKGLKQNKLTFDVIGGVSFNGFGIYCRYSPAKLFKDGYGPELKNVWTLGVALGF